MQIDDRAKLLHGVDTHEDVGGERSFDHTDAKSEVRDRVFIRLSIAEIEGYLVDISQYCEGLRIYRDHQIAVIWGDELKPRGLKALSIDLFVNKCAGRLVMRIKSNCHLYRTVPDVTVYKGCG